MRLTQQQQQLIKSILLQHFGQTSLIKVFGSRINDQAKGGDIDIYIEPEIKDPDAIIEAKIKALVKLHQVLGDQKLDLVINRTGQSDLAIYKQAQETGIVL